MSLRGGIEHQVSKFSSLTHLDGVLMHKYLLELMLMEGVYTCAIDVWSVGCILAELLGMLKESNVPPDKRHPSAHSNY